ncbi:MAG TPA: transglutaminase family protein [Polyangiaceae bacterium]|nr:transglutaminase family protein [Polyangiaceae bacterium]
MRVRVIHETVYEYDEPVTTSHHEVHLTPRDGEGQVCLAHDIAISPTPSAMRERFDYFGNRVRYFGVHESHRSLRIIAKSEVRMSRPSRPLPLWSPAWENVRDLLERDRRPDTLDAYGFTFDSEYASASPDLSAFVAPSFAAGRPLLEAVLDLTRRIFTEFVYDPTATQVSTPIAEVLENRRGVCQDFAHLMIGCLRSLGLPARYVSGYLLTTPPPGKARLVGADASHAWVSTYFPDIGWVDFDPTNNLMQSSQHVTVAFGRDFRDVSPLRGVILGGGRHALKVSVDVSPVSDASPSSQSQSQS